MTKNINRKPHRKVTKLKLKFSLILGLLNRALNNPAQSVLRVVLRYEFYKTALQRNSAIVYCVKLPVWKCLHASTYQNKRGIDLGIELKTQSAALCFTHGSKESG